MLGFRVQTSLGQGLLLLKAPGLPAAPCALAVRPACGSCPQSLGFCCSLQEYSSQPVSRLFLFPSNLA